MCGLVVIAACAVVACADGADAPAAKAPAIAETSAPQSIAIAFDSDPNPLRFGDNTVEVTVTNPDGSPMIGATVTATFYMAAMPSMNMPEMRSVFALEDKGAGRYRGAGNLVMNGTWDVTVNVARGAEKLGSKRLTVIAR
jgi:Cu(I)/Ag(I) efflux system membrane fusion protein/cobalt-zinc-cadmium efflux system membrane fusion protein